MKRYILNFVLWAITGALMFFMVLLISGIWGFFVIESTPIPSGPLIDFIGRCINVLLFGAWISEKLFRWVPTTQGSSLLLAMWNQGFATGAVATVVMVVRDRISVRDAKLLN